MSGCTEAQSTGITEDTIRAMAEVLVRRFHPKRIILFGSCARGTQTPDSDVDLLVVTRDDQIDPRDQAVRMRAALAEFRVPKDIVPLTPSQFSESATKNWTIAYEAVHTGRELYE